MSQTNCAVQGCKTTVFNKPVGVSFHPFPVSYELRKKWLLVLKHRCPTLDWLKSKICSKHFEMSYIDEDKNLAPNAIPTIFPSVPATPSTTATPSRPNTSVSTVLSHKSTPVAQKNTPQQKSTGSSILSNNSTSTANFGQKSSTLPNRPKFKEEIRGSVRAKEDRLLSVMSQSDLINDIKNTISLIKAPSNFSDCVTDDLKCIPNTPVEGQLYLLIKKQDHLIMRLLEQIQQNKRHVEVMQKNLESSRAAKKEMEQNVETLKYIVKCLQEKHATLEEQIEILTAVESRK